MEGAQCEVRLFEDDIPREIWMMLLGHLYSGMKASRYFGLSAVNSSWRKLVYESVTVIPESLLDLVTDEVLKRFCSLREVSLYGRWKGITDAGIRTATNLTNLNINYNCLITNKGISELTKLTTLRISERITDDGLRNLTNLTSLNLCSKISDDVVTKLTRLTWLDTWNTMALTGAGLKALTNLTSLSLALCATNRHGYDDALRQLTRLTRLGFSASDESNISDEGIKDLLNLTALDLTDNTFISDVGIENLTNLRSLELCASNTKSIRLVKITDSGLRNFVNLTSLDLRNNQSITDSGIVGLTNLCILDIHNANGITERAISQMVGLTSLYLNTSLSDDGVANLTNLTDLNLGENEILTNAGVVGLTKLKSLCLNGNIDDEGIKGLTNLTRLSLPRDKCMVSYDCVKLLPNLVEFHGLDRLGISRRDAVRVFNEIPTLQVTSCRGVRIIRALAGL